MTGRETYDDACDERSYGLPSCRECGVDMAYLSSYDDGLCEDCRRQEHRALQSRGEVIAETNPLGETEAINSRYLEYCRAHGRTYDEQRAFDEAQWTGGCMAGFILWMAERHAEFMVAHPECYLNRNLVDTAAFDAWLATVTTPLVLPAKRRKKAP